MAMLTPATHLPARQASFLLLSSPSSQGAPSGTGPIAQAPVLASQLLARQGTSVLMAQWTTLASLIRQVCGNAPVSQYRTPLQASSSLAEAQSASASHWHQLALEGWHAPC